MESFIKYPKVRRINDWFLGEAAVGYEDIDGMFQHPGDILVIQEKIDGANFRFMITESGDLVFGTRKNIITDDKDKSMKNFKRAVQFVNEMWKGVSKREKNINRFKRKIFFAEGCWKHSINYDWDNMPIILGFDVWDIEAEAFLPLDVIEPLFTRMGITMVPLVMKSPVAEFTTQITPDIVPRSKYYDGLAEGIVMKNYETQTIGKYVLEAAKQDQKKNFGEPPKTAPDDTSWLVAKFVTNTRIESFIFKLLDEGDKLGLHLMQYLPKLVLDDIWEEDFRTVYNSRKTYTFDFQKYKKLVQFRCKAVLRNMIQNNIISEKAIDDAVGGEEE